MHDEVCFLLLYPFFALVYEKLVCFAVALQLAIRENSYAGTLIVA